MEKEFIKILETKLLNETFLVRKIKFCIFILQLY